MNFSFIKKFTVKLKPNNWVISQSLKVTENKFHFWHEKNLKDYNKLLKQSKAHRANNIIECTNYFTSNF